MEDKVSLNEVTIKARKDFFELLKKSWTEFQKNDKKFEANDIRAHLFSIYSTSNLWLLIHLDTFFEMLNEKDTKIKNYMNLNPRSRIQYLSQHDTINRISYVTKVMFDVEDFIKTIMKGIEKSPHGKYYQFTKDLLTELQINDIQSHKILNAPYQIRNSLHNGGYAYHDFEIKLRDNQYNFIKGEQLKFTGWNHLYIFFDELIDLLITIVSKPEIQKIQSIPHTIHQSHKQSDLGRFNTIHEQKMKRHSSFLTRIPLDSQQIRVE